MEKKNGGRAIEMCSIQTKETEKREKKNATERLLITKFINNLFGNKIVF